MKMKKILIFAILVLTGVLGFSQVKNYKDIKYPEAHAPQKVTPYKFKLKNGLTVLLLEDHELPIVSGKILFHAGSVYDVKGKEGLAQLTADVLRTGGNSLKNGDEMDEFLESIAASVESYAGETSASVSFSCLKENVKDILPLFNATLTSPQFDEEKIKTAKAQMKASVMRRNDNPQEIAYREFSRLVYGKNSPLSAMVELASIDAITKEDMAKYHKEFYNPTNAVLAIWGDFNTKEMKKAVKSIFKSWKKGEKHKANLNISSAKPGVYYVQREGITQSNIRFGHLGVKKINPDYPAIVLFSRIFGGGFDSRMMKTIRRDKGLSYSPHGGIYGDYMYPGVFQVAINTKLQSTGEVIEIMKGILKDIQDKGVTEEELTQSRDGFLNSYAFQFDSLDKQIGRALTYEFYGYPQDFNDKFFNGLKAVTVKDIQRVAKKYVHLDNAILFLVCDKAKLDKPLETYGKVTEIDVTIPKPEVKKAGVVKTDATVKKGYEILTKAFAKIDPSDKLSNAQSFAIEVTKEVSMQGNKQVVPMVATIKYPDMLLLKVNQMGMDINMVVTPEKAEMRAMGQSRPLPPSQVASMKKIITNSLPMIARKLKTDNKCANFVKEGDFQGKKGFFVTFNGDNDETTYVIDDNFKIIGSISFEVNPRTGEQVEQVSSWGEYKDFNGIMYPATITTDAGQMKEVSTVKGITVNVKDVDSLFN
jgi:predicted Zn-dependent peptidase